MMTAKNQAVASTIALLAQRFPAAVSVFEQRRRPLAIGSLEVILTALPELDPKALKAALRAYCSNAAYLKSCAATGAMRVDLAGEPVGPVSEGDVASAASRLAAMVAKEADRKAARAAATKAARKAGVRSPSAPTTSPAAAAPASTEVSTSGSDRGPVRTSLSGLREAARQRRASA
jgi:sRNA-binding protein